MKKNFLLKIVLIVCMVQVVCINATNAQINNHALIPNYSIIDSQSNTVQLQIANQQFFRNNEFFKDMLTGYTLFGTAHQVQLSYQSHAHWKLEGGIFLRKDFGNSGIKDIQPLFKLKYQQQGYSFIFGNVEGNVGHKLLEPLLNYERFITHFNEYGMQFKVKKKRIESDSWINWEAMQYPESNFQEEFSAGHNSCIALFKPKKQELNLSLQALITHKGGQLDTDTTPIQTNLGAACGLEHKLHVSRFVQTIQTQVHALYSDATNRMKPALPNVNGSALFINSSIQLRNFITFSLGYWNASSFIAPRGADLFQSVSSPYTRVAIFKEKRELALLRILYQREILPQLFLDIRFEPYYNISESYTEYSYSCFLTYRKDFIFLNEKNPQKK